MAIKSPLERIRVLNETRYRFAAMESGLADWMAQVRTQPERADASASFSRISDRILSSGSGSPMATRNLGCPLEQPYYQQYLNASFRPTPSELARSTTAGSNPSRSNILTPSETSRGLSSLIEVGFSRLIM
jgi:hypothetical protein